jgi:protein-S-isoprenylcysteine O-methyltransferase Ste14
MAAKLRRWLVFNVVVCGGVLALSGQWTSPLVWSLVIGMSGLTLYAMTATDSDLAAERFRPPTKGEDRVALIFIRLSALAAVIISPLDGGRFHWSPTIPDAARFAAVAGMLIAFGLCFHAMVVNRYFSAVIRIQGDRGHRVVDAGPYSVIRHPGYLGMIIGVPLFAIGLGSWLGFVFASIYSLLIMRRVVVEDRFLRANLPGYPEYSTRVTSRLVPGVW